MILQILKCTFWIVLFIANHLARALLCYYAWIELVSEIELESGIELDSEIELDFEIELDSGIEY